MNVPGMIRKVALTPLIPTASVYRKIRVKSSLYFATIIAVTDLTPKVDPVNWSHGGEITEKLAAVIAKTEP